MLLNRLSYQTQNFPVNTLISDAQTIVTYTAQQQRKKTVLLFLPGALVEPTAYAPNARHAASHIVKMPRRMATRGYRQIKILFALTDTTRRYALAGYSQGGKIAAQFVYENRGLMAGLILSGTSYPRDIDLSSFVLPVVKRYTSNDGLNSLPEVFENKSKLPTHIQWVQIKGGNHAQFRYQGAQLGDTKASISCKIQQEIVNKTMVDFLNVLENQ